MWAFRVAVERRTGRLCSLKANAALCNEGVDVCWQKTCARVQFRVRVDRGLQHTVTRIAMKAHAGASVCAAACAGCWWTAQFNVTTHKQQLGRVSKGCSLKVIPGSCCNGRPCHQCSTLPLPADQLQACKPVQTAKLALLSPSPGFDFEPVRIWRELTIKRLLAEKINQFQC